MAALQPNPTAHLFIKEGRPGYFAGTPFFLLTQILPQVSDRLISYQARVPQELLAKFHGGGKKRQGTTSVVPVRAAKRLRALAPVSCLFNGLQPLSG
ncbi:MAG: hypothetical protein P4K83_13035 [Terracidiphilus sp.]|nr:hypothetical protein [Terracidiphilus sp.]